MNMKSIWRLCIGIVFGWLSTSLVYAEYTITDFGLNNATPYDINNAGEVVGEHHGKSFLWKGGLLSNFGLNGRSFSAMAINSTGKYVVTDYNYTNIYLINKKNSTPPVLKNTSGYHVGRDINDDEIIVGTHRIDGSWRPYVWREGGESLFEFDENWGAATAINNNDPVQIAGTYQNDDENFQAFLWTEGNASEADMHLIEGLDKPSSVATALNDNGYVVGWFNDSYSLYTRTLYDRLVLPYYSGSRAFIWRSSEEWIDLGTLAADNSGTSVATDINNLNQVVGYSSIDSGINHAFLYTLENGMIDLNTYLPDDSGWVLRGAYAINDNGQIIGSGTLNGMSRSFLLTPISMAESVDIAVEQAYQPLTPRKSEEFSVTTTAINLGKSELSTQLKLHLAPELEIVSAPQCIQNEKILSCDTGVLASGDRVENEITLKARTWGRFEVRVTAVGSENDVKDIATYTSAISVKRPEPVDVKSYHIKGLGITIDNIDDEFPRINAWGDVALAGTKGTFYRGGEIRSYSNDGVLLGINDDGLFVGYLDLVDSRAYTLDNEWKALDSLPDYATKFSKAVAVNDAGLKVGYLDFDAYSLTTDGK